MVKKALIMVKIKIKMTLYIRLMSLEKMEIKINLSKILIKKS